MDSSLPPDLMAASLKADKQLVASQFPPRLVWLLFFGPGPAGNDDSDKERREGTAAELFSSAK